MIRKTKQITHLITLAVLAAGIAEAIEFESLGLKLGGAIRANYVNGDYVSDGTDAAQRGDNGGNFELDTFRINADWSHENVMAKAEYRWYDGYNFFHTAYVGLKPCETGSIKAGLVRVPFGVGAYGPANSWFFDQHFYVGLSDDMDVGVVYSKQVENISLDLAYFAAAEPNGIGATTDSARYAYDVVSGDSEYGVYEERNQVNMRVIMSLEGESLSTDLGVSLQYGQLKADNDLGEDTDAYAASVHAKNRVGPITVLLQGTYYDYQADYTTESGLNNDLIAMGAYDFAWPVASQGFIPSVAVSYTFTPKEKTWFESITFYNDYSVIVKDGEMADGTAFNDSAMNVTGLAIAQGGWYIYADYAYSSGNYFVGNEGDSYGDTYAESAVGDFGANANDDWKGRFNVNFGYYF